MDIFNQVYTIVEAVAFVFLIFLFFFDPIRRWNFFGYRPTAVMGCFDPTSGKVLFSRINGAWSFNQGGMYENNIYVTVKNILRRELGISETRYKLSYTRPLGTVRIENKNLVNRARISTITIFNTPRGKGYLGCFIRTDLDGIESEIRPGAGVQEVRVVTLDEARRLAKEHTSAEHRPAKQAMILEFLDEIERYGTEIRDWETASLSEAPAEEEE